MRSSDFQKVPYFNNVRVVVRNEPRDINDYHFRNRNDRGRKSLTISEARVLSFGYGHGEEEREEKKKDMPANHD